MEAAPQQIAIAVPQCQDTFLVGVRPEGVALAGYWEFPGGKIEPTESPAVAAARECFEETGIEVRVLFQYPSRRQRYAHSEVHLQFFACEPIGSTRPRPPFRWVPRQDLTQLNFPEGNADLIVQLTTHDE